LERHPLRTKKFKVEELCVKRKALFFI